MYTIRFRSQFLHIAVCLVAIYLQNFVRREISLQSSAIFKQNCKRQQSPELFEVTTHILAIYKINFINDASNYKCRKPNNEYLLATITYQIYQPKSYDRQAIVVNYSVYKQLVSCESRDVEEINVTTVLQLYSTSAQIS